MNIIAHIIDTDSLKQGDFVAYKIDGKEAAGVFECHCGVGEIRVWLDMHNTIDIPSEDVTDIRAQ